MTQLNLPLRVVPVPYTNLVEIKDSVGEQLVKVEADDIFEVFVEAVNRSAAAEKLAEAIEQYLDHATDSEKNLDAALAAYRKDLSDGP